MSVLLLTAFDTLVERLRGDQPAHVPFNHPMCPACRADLYLVGLTEDGVDRRRSKRRGPVEYTCDECGCSSSWEDARGSFLPVLLAWSVGGRP